MEGMRLPLEKRELPSNISGAERFLNNHDYCVIGWDIDLSQNYWSFLYLPTERNDVRCVVEMRTNAEIRIRARMLSIFTKNEEES
jgi:hypothetical protein